MRVKYRANGMVREIPDNIARNLIARKIVVAVAEEEISPRTGKPKRQYKRRDMRAED